MKTVKTATGMGITGPRAMSLSPSPKGHIMSLKQPKRRAILAAAFGLTATAALAANWVGECTHPTHRFHSGTTNDRAVAQQWVDNHNRMFPDHVGYTRVRPW